MYSHLCISMYANECVYACVFGSMCVPICEAGSHSVSGYPGTLLLDHYSLNLLSLVMIMWTSTSSQCKARE